MMGRINSRKRSWNKIRKEIDLSIFVSASQSSGRSQSPSGSKN
jgi:hypothetical protein